MKSTFVISLLFLIGSSACAQQLERSLVASGGAYAQAGSLRLEYSIGDLVVNSVTTSGLILTQGFHQTYDFSTNVSESTSAELLAFPNPTTDHITIQWNGSNSGFTTIQLHDLLGQVVWSGRASLAGPFELDLSDHAAGAYFIRVTPENAPAVVVRVQKVG